MTTQTINHARSRLWLAWVAIAISISLWFALQAFEGGQRQMKGPPSTVDTVGRRYIIDGGRMQLVCGDGRPAIAARDDSGVTVQFCDVAPLDGR